MKTQVYAPVKEAFKKKSFLIKRTSYHIVVLRA